MEKLRLREVKNLPKVIEKACAVVKVQAPPPTPELCALVCLVPPTSQFTAMLTKTSTVPALGYGINLQGSAGQVRFTHRQR